MRIMFFEMGTDPFFGGWGWGLGQKTSMVPKTEKHSGPDQFLHSCVGVRNDFVGHMPSTIFSC